MALTPKELLKPDPEQVELLKTIETLIDCKLSTYEMEQGKVLSFSFEDVKPRANPATIKALKRLYTKAGWRDVQINTTHSIITMTCPRYRGGRGPCV